MSCQQDAQQEEKEVLLSIYDGDECFKPLENAFQYRIGEDGHPNSFLLEIRWGENYPEELPKITLDAFYNSHLSKIMRCNLISKINDEADQWLGSAMTYTLFEWAKENAAELMTVQIGQQTPVMEGSKRTNNDQPATAVAKSKERKEILTKSQKRKLANRTDHKGERPRGWDWVDIVKLSKSGFVKQEETSDNKES